MKRINQRSVSIALLSVLFLSACHPPFQQSKKNGKHLQNPEKIAKVDGEQDQTTTSDANPLTSTDIQTSKKENNQPTETAAIPPTADQTVPATQAVPSPASSAALSGVESQLKEQITNAPLETLKESHPVDLKNTQQEKWLIQELKSKVEAKMAQAGVYVFSEDFLKSVTALIEESVTHCNGSEGCLGGVKTMWEQTINFVFNNDFLKDIEKNRLKSVHLTSQMIEEFITGELGRKIISAGESGASKIASGEARDSLQFLVAEYYWKPVYETLPNYHEYNALVSKTADGFLAIDNEFKAQSQSFNQYINLIMKSAAADYGQLKSHPLYKELSDDAKDLARKIVLLRQNQITRTTNAIEILANQSLKAHDEALILKEKALKVHNFLVMNILDLVDQIKMSDVARIFNEMVLGQSSLKVALWTGKSLHTDQGYIYRSSNANNYTSCNLKSVKPDPSKKAIDYLSINFGSSPVRPDFNLTMATSEDLVELLLSKRPFTFKENGQLILETSTKRYKMGKGSSCEVYDRSPNLPFVSKTKFVSIGKNGDKINVARRPRTNEVTDIQATLRIVCSDLIAETKGSEKRDSITPPPMAFDLDVKCHNSAVSR